MGGGKNLMTDSPVFQREAVLRYRSHNPVSLGVVLNGGQNGPYAWDIHNPPPRNEAPLSWNEDLEEVAFSSPVSAVKGQFGLKLADGRVSCVGYDWGYRRRSIADGRARILDRG